MTAESEVGYGRRCPRCGGAALRPFDVCGTCERDMGWDCEECGGYGVLDGLEPCPANCEKSQEVMASLQRDDLPDWPEVSTPLAVRAVADVRLTDQEREALLRAWPWPQEAATTRDDFWAMPATVEKLIADRLAAALAIVKRACDGECKSPGKHTGCSSHEPYRVLAAELDIDVRSSSEVDRSDG